MAARPGGNGGGPSDGWERPSFHAPEPPAWIRTEDTGSGSVRRISVHPAGAGRHPTAGLGVRPAGRDRSGPIRPGVATVGRTPWMSRGLPDQLPTAPTLLAAGLVVLLAFVVGHATGGGGGQAAAAAKPAAVATTTTTTLPPRPATHTVVAGDTLSSIASLYGLAASDLATYNGITNLNHVFTGEVLKIPPAGAATTAPATVTTLKP